MPLKGESVWPETQIEMELALQGSRGKNIPGSSELKC